MADDALVIVIRWTRMVSRVVLEPCAMRNGLRSRIVNFSAWSLTPRATRKFRHVDCSHLEKKEDGTTNSGTFEPSALRSSVTVHPKGTKTVECRHKSER